ncbi:MAG: hypothetical protein J0H89_01655 [Rhizobiales bacterium]|nr:hypothetical protein [Hyphomicrobiales bacterium]
MTQFLRHAGVTWLGHKDFQAADTIFVHRLDGHKDAVTPDERAPFLLWSFCFLDPRVSAVIPGAFQSEAHEKQKARVSPGLRISVSGGP